jgi:copper chaperone NosL
VQGHLGRTIALLAASSLLGGCGKADLSRPPSLRFGEEACAFCRMIISDERFAAALTTASGDVLKFDDVGCLIKHEEKRLRPDTFYWVCNFQGKGWLNAQAAIFVHSPSIVSPMNHGLAALPDIPSAAEFTKDPASRKLRFSELPGFVGDPPRATASNRLKPN